MGFGFGPASEMNKTVHRLRRPRHETLNKMSNLVGDDNSKLTDKKATPQQLADIRQKLQKENRQKNIRLAIYIALFFLSIYILYILT